ncbi:SH3 domain-containing protein [Pontiella sulfatireligans]|uniref:Uncharacterized protein n=1 Tax=Pontiella sulfatireligans TaxID=2750658 RepID=A0A6C2UT25_9BACT|nr:hypothetical protein [Pontiella sulfatireligans]VGO22367.1 hypothetical protein SCARR_04450 [Pontiella sulfatireligans]
MKMSFKFAIPFGRCCRSASLASRQVLSFKLLLLVAAMPALGSDYQLQTLEKANGMFRAATNSAMYAEAARQFEYLVTEEGVRNEQLFYTLGNNWFMAGDVGRAILNYRRAEQYLPNNADLKHNLSSALELRTDLIPEKEPHPLAAKLLGWHFKSSTALRWWLFAFVWMLFWGAWLWARHSTKKEAGITLAVTAVLSVVLLASLLTEYIQEKKATPGVITANEVLARKGDGDMYAPAFLEPLHSGSEFQTLEVRGPWRHIRLADGQTCWISSAAAESVALP